jgi:hypothetical protein
MSRLRLPVCVFVDGLHPVIASRHDLPFVEQAMRVRRDMLGNFAVLVAPSRLIDERQDFCEELRGAGETTLKDWTSRVETERWQELPL